MKQIDIDISVYYLCRQYPDIKDILKEAGFTDITKPMMLETAGRFMTLRKGAKLKKIELTKLNEFLNKYGYEINTALDE
jgi:N-dimethylarginine dimethylaminohydrolase